MDTPSDQLITGDDDVGVSMSVRDFGRMYDVIEISPDGTSLLGSSDMNTRYWNGMLSVFDSPADLGNLKQCRASMDFEGGLSCAKFVSPSKVVVGLDSGGVVLVDVAVKPGAGPSLLASCVEHDNVVSSLSVAADGTRAVTGSLDRSMKVWNTDYLVCSHTYRPAHPDSVVSVAIHPEQLDVIASCSEDGRVILWDLRVPKPAHVVRRPFASRPSCVAFLHGRNTLNLLIGTVSGHLLQLDAAAPESPPLIELGAHRRAIRVIRPADQNADRSLVATCADDYTVVAVTVNPAHPKIIYSDETHNDLVRSLAWSNNEPNQFYSCAWDSKILAHDIASSST